MKKYIIYILVLFGIKLNGQNSVEINSGIIKTKGVFLKLDTIGRPLFKDDSLYVNLFLVFNQNMSEITRINLLIGDTLDKENAFLAVFSITATDGKYFISGKGISDQQLNYGSNLLLDVKCRSNNNFKWATIYYQNSQNVTSSKKYIKVNG